MEDLYKDWQFSNETLSFTTQDIVMFAKPIDMMDFVEIFLMIKMEKINIVGY